MDPAAPPPPRGAPAERGSSLVEYIGLGALVALLTSGVVGVVDASIMHDAIERAARSAVSVLGAG